jgi:hypothetical protein
MQKNREEQPKKDIYGRLVSGAKAGTPAAEIRN